MSKKTKRLEKENLTLTRKHDLTNRNILEMAEERTKTNKELVTLRKKNANLENLCRGMQAQGRGTAVGPAATAVAGHTTQTRTDGEVDALEEEDEEEGTESDYTYDDDASEGRDDHDDDDGSESIGDDDEGEYEDDEDEDEDGDDETEEELLRSTTGIVAPPPPPPPPPPPALAAAAAAALPTPSTPMVNGQKRSRSQPSQHQPSKDQQDHPNGPTATNGASH